MESKWRRAVLYASLLGCLKGNWKSGIPWQPLNNFSNTTVKNKETSKTNIDEMQTLSVEEAVKPKNWF